MSKDKNGSHISNGYSDTDGLRIELLKLFKKEGISENKTTFKNNYNLNWFLKNIIDGYLQNQLPQDELKRKPKISRVEAFERFFTFWDAPEKTQKISLVHEGRQIEIEDRYLLNVLVSAIDEYKVNLNRSYEIRLNGRNYKFKEVENYDHVKHQAFNELIAETRISRKIYALRNDTRSYLFHNGYFTKSDRFINILTYKILETAKLLETKESDNARNTFIEKHLTDNLLDYQILEDNDNSLEVLHENPTKENVNAFLKSFYNRIFKIR